MRIMQSSRKNIILGALSALCLSATATMAADTPTPPSFAGAFAFQGRMQALITLDMQEVYLGAAGGEARKEELEKQGYECRAQDNHWWGCQKLRNDLLLPPAFAQQFSEKYRGKLQLRFGNITAPPQLLHSSGDLSKWRFNQRIELDGQTLASFQFLQTAGAKKILLPSSELVLLDQDLEQRAFGFLERISDHSADGSQTLTYYFFLVLDPQP